MDDCGPLFHSKRRPRDLEYYVSHSFRNFATANSPLLYRGRKLEKPHREKSIFAITRNCISLHTVLSLSEQGQWILLPGFSMRAYGKRLESPSIYREAEKTGNVREKIHFSLVSKRYIGAPQILTDRICRLSQSRVIARHTSAGIIWGVAMACLTYPSSCASAVRSLLLAVRCLG